MGRWYGYPRRCFSYKGGLSLLLGVGVGGRLAVIVFDKAGKSEGKGKGKGRGVGKGKGIFFSFLYVSFFSFAW